MVSTLGLAQILAWGSSYYLPAVLAKPIAESTGWSLELVVGGLSWGLLVQGLVSPAVGRAIDRHGGRPILALSAILLAIGLAALAFAPGIVGYFAAWTLVGLGMGAGLYDAAFSTLGKLYGLRARGAITILTLFGGFASTVCWPLSAYLSAEFGWRSTCLIYAAAHLGLALPAYWFLLPRRSGSLRLMATRETSPGTRVSPPDPRLGAPFYLMAAGLTICSVIAAIVSVHLLTLLQARGLTLAEATALGTLVGPSQVGARLIEMLLGRRRHPIWTMVASALLIAAGIAWLWAEVPFLSLALVLYGAGMGIKSIARGTLPLAVFGSEAYASIMGRLAMPGLIAGASAPTLGAFIMGQFGNADTLGLLAVLALANMAAIGVLAMQLQRTRLRPS